MPGPPPRQFKTDSPIVAWAPAAKVGPYIIAALAVGACERRQGDYLSICHPDPSLCPKVPALTENGFEYDTWVWAC